MNRMTPREIGTWVPAGLHEVAGNANLKAHFADFIRAGGFHNNAIITGPSGSGKTATIKAAVRTLMCAEIEPTTLIPCGLCDACLQFDVRYAEEGFYSLLRQRVARGATPLNYFPVNCGRITEAELRSLLQTIEQAHDFCIVYLDEVHRLAGAKRELLLVPLRELDAVWIASSVTASGLEAPFIKRFAVKLQTEPPTHDELVQFLFDRCAAWHVFIDHKDTLHRLTKRSGRNVCDALDVISRAIGQSHRLTRELVDTHCFWLGDD